MGKPRVIIADSDFSYIIPLQLKFAEQFRDRIDLEIISDPAFCAQMFSTPHKIDILIISEGMYDPSLRRQNIGHLFLMTEQPEVGRTGELDVEMVYKYTSIMSIYNEISGKSRDVLEPVSDERSGKKEPQIVMVYSAAGGVGKTTLALGISASLAKNYKKVLYINAGRLQHFQTMLRNGSAIASADVYAKLNNSTANVYDELRHIIRTELFSYLPPFRAALMSLGLRYSIFERIAVNAKNSREYDYIVIDADSAFDEENAHLMHTADKVVIVTDQHRRAVYATNLLVANINGISSDKYFFICNNFDKDDNNALVNADGGLRFSVNDYVEHIPRYDQLACEDLPNSNGIQRVSVLVM